MNKKIIAAAIAASFVAPAAMASDDVTVYGKIRQSLTNMDVNNGTTDEWQINDHTSRIGFKGSEDLGNGLKAIYQFESGIQLSEGGAGPYAGAGNLRNTFVGLAGDFGTVLIGRHDAPHNMAWSKNNPFGDTEADFKSGMFSPIEWERVDGTIAYVSPSFSGLTVAGAIVPGEATGTNDGIADATSWALMYGNGPIYASLGYFDNMGSNTDEWNATFMYTMDALKLGVTYEQDEQGAGAGDEDTWLLSGAYTMGNNVIKAQYFDSEMDAANSDSDGWALGLQHNFSKRTDAQILYVSADAEAGSSEADGDAFSIQLNHNF